VDFFLGACAVSSSIMCEPSFKGQRYSELTVAKGASQ
jgi:hypothetical protein